jgi:hypothetical protein
MISWRTRVKRTCPRHGQRMAVDKHHDGEPKREGKLIRVKCLSEGCTETSTVTEYEARDDYE